MRNWLKAFALSAVAAPACAADLPPPETIATPTGGWVVDYAEGACVLQRSLDAGGRKALFTVTREPITSTSWLRLGIEEEPRSRDDGEAAMIVDGRLRADGIHYNFFASGGPYQVREYMLDLGEHPVSEVRERLRFRTRRHGDFELALDGFQMGWQGLEACMKDLYADLGISQSDLAQIAVEPDGWAFDAVRMPRELESLDVSLLYWVTSRGRVENCRLLRGSGIADFDAKICPAIEAKARLEPARNAAGERIRAPHYERARIETAVVYHSIPR